MRNSSARGDFPKRRRRIVLMTPHVDPILDAVRGVFDPRDDGRTKHCAHSIGKCRAKPGNVVNPVPNPADTDGHHGQTDGQTSRPAPLLLGHQRLCFFCHASARVAHSSYAPKVSRPQQKLRGRSVRSCGTLSQTVWPCAIVFVPSWKRISTFPRSITRATTPSPNFGCLTSSPLPSVSVTR